ncbi:MAG: ammonium transporter [Myxococcales bacterium]
MATIDFGNTAWVLTSAALVLLMTPGLGFFYGGLVGRRNVLNTVMMSVIAMGVVAVIWTLLGYSLAFAPGNAAIGDLSLLALSGVGAAPRPDTTVPHLAFMAFQMMFAVITPALISGAIVGRMRFGAWAAFIALWSLLVYSPLAHWVWGGGWVGKLGTLDFAGGTVVHISAGFSALAAAIFLGPRKGHRQHAPKPHNVPFVLLGAGLLWFGWFGFNAGSALAADGIASLALVNTMLGASSALLAWAGLESLRARRPSAVGAATGAVVGLVAITPAAGYVTPLGALAIGALGATASFLVIQRMARSRLDDSLDVFACHGIGGLVGSLLTGVFASKAANPAGADGLLYGGIGLLGRQAIGVAAAAAFALVGTVVILKGLKWVTSLRVHSDHEEAGLDLSEHGESAYSAEVSMGERAVHAGQVVTHPPFEDLKPVPETR